MGPDIPHGGPGQVYGLSIAVVVALVLIAWRNRKPQRLLIERLWVRPVIFGVLIGVTLSASPINAGAESLAIFALALAIGGGLGWQRGRLMRIEVHPETHDVTSRASPLGMVFIMGILVLRILLRGAAMESRSALGVSAAVVTDALVLMLGAMVVVQGLEMWLRARRLLDAARSARPPADGAGSQPPLVS
jgi:hypothetical protein